MLLQAPEDLNGREAAGLEKKQEVQRRDDRVSLEQNESLLIELPNEPWILLLVFHFPPHIGKFHFKWNFKKIKTCEVFPISEGML